MSVLKRIFTESSEVGEKKLSMDSNRREILGLLSLDPLFSEKSLAEQKEVSKLFTLAQYRKNDFIVEQNTVGNKLFLVAFGTVELVRIDGDGGERSKGKLAKHEVFGEYALVHPSYRYSFGVRASSKKVTVLEMDRTTYLANCQKKIMSNLRKRIDAAGDELVRTGLQSIPFLSNIDPEKIAKIGSYLRFKALPKGYCMYKEGDNGNRLFILLTGECVVTIKDDLGFDRELNRIKPVTTFGESALTNERKREATVTTMTESTVFFLDKADLELFFVEVPNLRVRILQSIEDSDFANVYANRIPVFKELSPMHKYRLGVGAKRVRIPKGTIVKSQGESKDLNFYIIIKGSVDVLKDGSLIRSLGEGEYFGEIGLLSAGSNTATVKVKHMGCLCLSIRPEVFQSIIVDEPAVAAEMSIRVKLENSPLEDVLHHPVARQLFLKYCEKELAEENIDFWLDVRKLEGIQSRVIYKSVLKAIGTNVESVKSKKDKLMKAQVEHIANRYIVDDAEAMINISAEVRDPLMNLLDEGKYSFDMFSETSVEVYKLVQADNFIRFKDSDDFTNFLNEIGRYGYD